MKHLKTFENYISIHGYDYTEAELDYIKNKSKFQFDDYVKPNVDIEIKQGTVCKIIKITSHNYTNYSGIDDSFFSYKIQDNKGNSDFFNEKFLDFATSEEIKQFKIEETINKYNL